MHSTVIYKERETIQRFRKITRWPLRLLVFLGILALTAPLISNEQPLYVNYKGHVLFPLFAPGNTAVIRDPLTGKTERLQYDITEWKKLNTTAIVFPPVTYSPGKSDFANADFVAPAGEQLFENAEGKIIRLPWRYRHWLGTGKNGDDVLAGLIHGTRISFTVGILAMLIASVIGIILGALAGYYGDYTITISRGQAAGLFIGLLPAWFYGFSTRYYTIVDSMTSSIFLGALQISISLIIFIAILFLFFKAAKIVHGIGWFGKMVAFPVDSIVSRTIEIFISMPRLLLIITVAAILKPSFVNLVLILGFTGWTDIARLTRAEFLKFRELDFITAARSLGFSNSRIIFRHVLPNGIGPVMVTIAFGAAAAILAESGLSFLGIGVPQDTVTWGSLLATGKENVRAWWLIVFPGMAIFTSVIIYNLLGEGLRKALLPSGHAG
jgi:peptide/nickel transport system permease protein